MELKTTKVYVPNEDFEQSLVKEAISDIFTICHLNNSKTAKELLSSQFLILNNLDYKEQSLYIFTKEELKRVIEDAFDAARSKEDFIPLISMGGMKYKTKQEYINQILK